MSGLTAEGARAAADAYEAANGDGWKGSRWLRAEADRLEAAVRTPGQVLAELFGVVWGRCSPDERDTYERRAAALIAHVVGPGQVILDRDMVVECEEVMTNGGHGPAAAYLREALK